MAVNHRPGIRPPRGGLALLSVGGRRRPACDRRRRRRVGFVIDWIHRATPSFLACPVTPVLHSSNKNPSFIPTTARLALLLALVLALGMGCKRNGNKGNAQQPAEIPKTPTLRLYLASTVAGALEPCGCVKDMLGGIDHAAALVSGGADVPRLVLGAGPLYFLSPTLSEERRAQDQWKAESIAASMADIGLLAWAPGANDFALGTSELSQLAKTSQAEILAGNLSVEGLATKATLMTDVGQTKVGIAGVSVPKHSAGLPPGVQSSDPKQALLAAKQELDKSGAQLKIALLAMQRGQALRLAESVPGFQVMVVGKASDMGEANDAPTPPVLVGETLVVQGPNHLQGMAVVELFVRGDSFEFADASGVEQQEQRTSLQQRIATLEKRIAEWKQAGSVSEKDLRARESDLTRLQQELGKLSAGTAPKEGSFFRYELLEVREKVGSDPRVAERLLAYYKRVNEHNKEAFKDKKPEPAEKGEAHFVGSAACKECHEDAYAFWKTTRHSSAYETLAVEFKEFNLDCVSCHVTGYEKPGGSTVTFVENLKDVQCEECHNAGSAHIKSEDVDDILLTPPKTLCKKCHHTPHVGADWDVEHAWKGIIGQGHGL